MTPVPVDLNRVDDMGYHALHHAAANNFHRIVLALLGCPGVAVGHRNTYGATAAAVAEQTGHHHLAATIRELVGFLCSHLSIGLHYA
jgi:ankyrin repeat protein